MGDDWYERQRDSWRVDDARYDRELAERDRAESDERGWRAAARGDSLWAINAFAGPELAASYAARMAETDEGWPVHRVAIDVEDCVDNMKALPRGMDAVIRDVSHGWATFAAVGRADPDTEAGTFTAKVETILEFLSYCETFELSASDAERVRTLRAQLRRPK